MLINLSGFFLFLVFSNRFNDPIDDPVRKNYIFATGENRDGERNNNSGTRSPIQEFLFLSELLRFAQKWSWSKTMDDRFE